MSVAGFASFKYQHGQGGVFSGVLTPLKLGLMVVLSLAGLVVVGAWGFLAGPALLVFWLIRGSRFGLLIGPRYLICGQTIVYYRNLQRVVLGDGGTLTLITKSQQLRIEQKRFPTGARKTAKIEHNTRVKFDKVTTRIIARVRELAPQAEIVGKLPDGAAGVSAK